MVMQGRSNIYPFGRVRFSPSLGSTVPHLGSTFRVRSLNSLACSMFAVSAVVERSVRAKGPKGAAGCFVLARAKSLVDGTLAIQLRRQMDWDEALAGVTGIIVSGEERIASHALFKHLGIPYSDRAARKLNSKGQNQPTCRCSRGPSSSSWST